MNSIQKPISIITGGAGFIGVNLINHLLQEDRTIYLLDNMSRGSRFFVENAPGYNEDCVKILDIDCANPDSMYQAFKSISHLGVIDEVWHLAANSDIPAGILDSKIDLKDTFLTTFYLLEAMKIFGVKRLFFASSSAVYGDFGDISLVESLGPLLPISNYGAMKLSSEAIISAASEVFFDQVCIFRFPNVVGVPATHGVILDFINKLIVTPESLSVLGDGSQQKAYLHVEDLIQAMLVVRAACIKKIIQVINIGPLDDGVTVKWISEQVVKRVSPSAKIQYGVGNKGWVGDVPKFNYSTQKLQSFGWKPQLNSAGAVNQAIHEIALQLGK